MSEERKDDTELRNLYVELDAVDAALDVAMGVVEAATLRTVRAHLLGEIKKLERKHNESS